MDPNPALRDDVSILLVDDQPAKLLTYGAILRGVDATLVTAGSGREALEHLLKTDFAVVLIDVIMPELDGFELAAMMREHPRFRKTAIIFVSGVALTELDRLKGYEYGAVDYVPVPVVPEILRAKVRVFVELHRKTRQLERLNRGLEARVAERTAELQEASRRKDEFLATLAHELRNPLAAIRLAAQLIGMADLPPAQRANSVAVIQRQVEHLVRLIDDLVDVSRITRGLISLRRHAGARVERRHAGDRVEPPGHRRAPASAARAPAVERAVGGRRRRAVGPGARQHPEQRRQVHRPGGTNHARRPLGGCGCHDPDHRLGCRDRGRDAPAGVRVVHAIRPAAGSDVEWIGHRSRAGAAPRRDARRDGRSRERGPRAWNDGDRDPATRVGRRRRTGRPRGDPTFRRRPSHRFQTCRRAESWSSTTTKTPPKPWR